MKSALLARRTILAASIDTELYVDEAFDQIVSKGSHVRKESYELLTINLEDSQKHHNKRCVPVIEKLPTLLETVRKEEHESFLRFVSVLADNISAEILSAWNKNMPKIVSTILRILNGRNGRGRSLFMLNVIHKLATSRVRNALIPNLKVLKEASYQLLSNNHTLEHHQRELLTDVLAALVSLEPISQYYASINDIVLEMSAVLSKLTLFPSKASGQDKPQICLFNMEKVLTPLVTGVNKVQILEGLFAQLNVLYSKILRSGHSSAFASMDFTGFIVLQRAILMLFADVNTNDPAVFIENEERISKVDLALISSRLKLSVVTTLRHILELNLPGLIRYGSLFLHPLCVLLGRREVHTVPMLLQEVLLTLQVASRVLPTSTWMVLQSTGSLQVLLQLLQIQCELISGERKHYSALDQTSSSASSSSKTQKKDAQALQLEQDGNLVFHATALVLASASIAQHQHHQVQQQQQNSALGKRKHYVDQDVEPANDALTLLILATVDAVLLHNGRLLVAQPEGKEFMEKLQIALLFPLVAMQRGLLPSHFQDKKMHRLFAERVRHSLALQAAVLRTAGNVFLVTGAAEHMYLPIIRDVAQVVLHQVGRGADSTLGCEAQRVLLLTGHLVHPSVLPMPSTAPTVLASEYLAKEKKRRREEATQRELDEAGAEGRGSESAVATSAASSSTTAASAPLFVQPSSSSASITAVAAAPLSYAASQPAAVPQPAVKATKLSSKAPAATAAKKNAAAMKTDDDDDDDIPDIDISSDQE